jgi:hypothetical protein
VRTGPFDSIPVSSQYGNTERGGPIKERRRGYGCGCQPKMALGARHGVAELRSFACQLRNSVPGTDAGPTRMRPGASGESKGACTALLNEPRQQVVWLLPMLNIFRHSTPLRPNDYLHHQKTRALKLRSILASVKSDCDHRRNHWVGQGFDCEPVRTRRAEPRRPSHRSSTERLKQRDGLQIFAWSLLGNHFHLAVRTSAVPLSRTKTKGTSYPCP